MCTNTCIGTLALLTTIICSANAIEKCKSIQIGEEIGRGGYGAVYEAFDEVQCNKDGCYKPPKFVAKNFTGSKAEKHSRAEYNILLRLKHEFECKFDARSNGEIPRFSTVNAICEIGSDPHIITDFIPDSLLSGTRSISEEIKAIHGLATAVQQIHSLGFVHLDLKPENVRIGQDGIVKLIDFGLSEELDPNKLYYQFTKGSLYYMAPEVLRKAQIPYSEMKKIDIWGIGMIVFEMVVHKELYDNNLSTPFNNCFEEQRKTVQMPKKIHRYDKIKIFYLVIKAALNEFRFIEAENDWLEEIKGENVRKVAESCIESRVSKINLQDIFLLNLQHRWKEEGLSTPEINLEIKDLVFNRILQFFSEDRDDIDKVVDATLRFSQGGLLHDQTYN